MTSKVPPDIRELVLTLWLRAYSREEIARIIGIGAGTVSEIVKAYNQRNSEFVLLREFVIVVKKEGGQLASATKLQRVLESHNLGGEQIESLIRIAANHCFKKEVGVQRFIEEVDKVSELVDKTGVAIENLYDHIQETKRDLYSVTMELSGKSRECDEKRVQLEELRKSLSWERFCHRFLADELGKASKLLYAKNRRTNNARVKNTMT
jgi:hypothetical protein